MGEARKRKETDPLYGKVAKDSTGRGIIVSSPMRIDGTHIQLTGGGLDPQELRFALLFWDELVWPQNNIFQSGPIDQPDIVFLEESKVLTRPRQEFRGGDFATLQAQTMLSKFAELENKEPGKWSIAQGERAFNLVNTEEVPGALLELIRAVPIPQADVPLNEILEFKRRRRDELLQFRAHLDSLAKQIAQSDAPAEVLAKHLAEIDRACSDLMSVGRDWQFPVQLSSFKASLNIDPTKLAMSTSSVYLGATYLGLPLAAAAAGLAAVGSLLNVKADIGFRGIKRPRSPYRYAYEIAQELSSV